MKIDAERLRGFLDCMHEEADQRDKRSEAIRDIVKAAKEAGYDTKAVRKVFVRERMDEGERARQDDLLETYEAVLGPKGAALRAIEAGARVGEAAVANGVHRATLARARNVAKQPSNATVANEPSIATPHDADGVILDAQPPAEVVSTANAPEETPVAEEVPAKGFCAAENINKTGDFDPPAGDFGAGARLAVDENEVQQTVSVGAVAGPEATRVATPEPDDLEIPAFLDRRSSTGTSAHNQEK